MHELKLEWVFGYRGHQCRNNLFVNKNGELVYFVAGLGVVLNVEKQAQKVYNEHKDDILCLSVDKSGTLAATGQIGDDPFLCVWDTLSMQTISILKPFKHGNGIGIVGFSMNDDHLLVTVGLDDKATVSIWDWKKAKLIAHNAAESIEKVFDARFHHSWPQMVVTCGLRHVCIWKLCGNVLSPSRIVLDQTVMCMAFGDDAVTLVGALNGSVYLCHKRECVGEVENAHLGGVFCVCQTKDTYITGGRDGSLSIWDSKFKRLSSIDLRKKTGISDLWIRSVCTYNDSVFVGSHNSDIIMVSLRDRENIKILVDGHGQGELWALAVHPKKDVFATGGDDRTVRLWSSGEHTLLKTASLEQWIRSVAFNQDGSMLICGLADGSVAVLKTKDLTTVLTFKNRKRPIHELQLSPSGDMLAVGCNDGSIDICSISQRFKIVGSCDVGKDHVTHCDWSADGKLLRANTGAGQQFVFKVPGFKKVPDINPATAWATETCVLAPNVAGIWPKYSKTDEINAVDVNKAQKLVATGDDFGTVKLFQEYPLTDSGKKVLKYKGHSAHVTNVRWMADGNKLVSIGGADHAAFVWRLEENKDNIGDDGELSTAEAEDVDSDVEREKMPIERRSVTKDKATTMIRQLIRTELKQEGKRRADPPTASLKLVHVFGYRGYDCHNNLCFTQDGRLIFHVAALGIVQDRDSGKQRFYIGHTDDILCLAIHPQKDIVATGEIGRHPTIHIWDAEKPEQQPLSVLKGHHSTGVCALDFSGDDGKKLISVGLDTNHTIIVWDWKRGEKLAEARGNKDKVFGIRFDPFDSAKAVSVGVKHIKFWATAGGGLTSARGVFGSVAKMETMMCVEYGKQKGCCYSGAANGMIYCWLDTRLTRTVDAHKGPVFAIFALEKGFVTGGKDGKAVLWDEMMEKKLKSYSVGDQESSEQTVGNLTAIPNPAVRAVALGHSKIAAGTKSGEILEIDKSGSIRVLTKGHCAGEIWGLAAHPKENLCCTGSDDGFVRIWEFGTKFEQRAILNVQKPARSVEFSSDGQYLGVGFSDGSVSILETASLHKTFEFHHRNEEISDIKFAPEPHKFVAIASHDNFIDVYDYQEGKRVGVCKGHSSYVTHIDWDATGALLASNSGDRELLFFAMPKGEQQMLPAEVADETVQWHTRTGVLNPNIFGIWPPSSDVTDLNAVDVHPQMQLVATADDFGFVKIFRYPCKEKYAKSKRYLGHSAHVASVRWSHDGQYLLSIGGADTSLCIWKLYNDDEKKKQNNNDAVAESPKAAKQISVDEAAQFGQSDSSDTDSEEEGGYDSDVEAEKNIDYSSKMYSQPQREQVIMENRQLIEGGTKPPVSRTVHEKINVQRKDPGTLKDKKIITDINNLKLDHIFGYRGFDCANNLAYLNEGADIVYHTAGVGVVLSLASGRQKFYQKHTDDILCLAVNRNSKFSSLVATGQIDLKSPMIHVWDSNTMKTVSMIKMNHSDGANCIDFSPSGKYLLTVGINAERTISVFKWQDGSIVAKCSGHSRKVFDARFRPDSDSTFVVVGTKCVKFWKISGDQLIAKKAVLGNQATAMPTMLSAAFAPNGITYTGCVTGDIFVWKEERLERIIRKAHNGPIFSMHTSLTDGLITTGAKEKRAENAACVKIWDQELSRHRPYRIQSVSDSDVQEKIVVGTKLCDIVEIQEQNGAAYFVMQSHADGELKGLACHPSKLIAATTGRDRSLRLWDIDKRKTLLRTKLEEKATCAAFSVDGSLIAVGTDNGKIVIFHAADLTPWGIRRDRSACITQLKFSPDKKYLAVGYQESFVDIYDMNSKPSDLQKTAYYKFSSQSVAHMDFSADSKFIKASTTSFDIFVLKVPECALVTDKNEIKNIMWSTWTDVAGPEVAGIWSEKPSEANINCAALANFSRTLVTGDAQGFVSLFPFPCREPQEVNKKFEGHSALVSNVGFTFDDSFVISTGGEDASVFVWRCEK